MYTGLWYGRHYISSHIETGELVVPLEYENAVKNFCRVDEWWSYDADKRLIRPPEFGKTGDPRGGGHGDESEEIKDCGTGFTWSEVAQRCVVDGRKEGGWDWSELLDDSYVSNGTALKGLSDAVLAKRTLIKSYLQSVDPKEGMLFSHSYLAVRIDRWTKISERNARQHFPSLMQYLEDNDIWPPCLWGEGVDFWNQNELYSDKKLRDLSVHIKNSAGDHHEVRHVHTRIQPIHIHGDDPKHILDRTLKDDDSYWKIGEYPPPGLVLEDTNNAVTPNPKTFRFDEEVANFLDEYTKAGERGRAELIDSLTGSDVAEDYKFEAMKGIYETATSEDTLVQLEAILKMTEGRNEVAEAFVETLFSTETQANESLGEKAEKFLESFLPM